MSKGDKKLENEILEDDTTTVTEDEVPGSVAEDEEKVVVDPSTGSGQDWEEKYKRALADYQNLEKRTQENRREWILSSNRELLLRVLPVLDTLTMAMQHSDDKSLAVSVQQFLNILKSEGVAKIETVGQEFNPHLMEAVATDEGEDGIVLAEIQSGYTIHDKLLRPALVKVGKSGK